MLIAMSDIHLGHPTSLLNESTAVLSLAETIRTITIDKPFDLILMGDIVDFCYIDFFDGMKKFSDFIATLCENKKIKESLRRIIWIVGNHDYHLMTVLFDRFGYTKYSDLIYKIDQYEREEDGVDRFWKDVKRIQLLPSTKQFPDVYVTYPEYFIWDKDFSRSYVFTHGHLVGTDGRLFSAMLGDMEYDIESVCSANHAWIEFAWYGIFRDKRIAKKVMDGYSFLSSFTVATKRGKKISELSGDMKHYFLNIRHYSRNLTHFIFGHTHNSGQEKINVMHSVPGSKKPEQVLLTMTNAGAWIVDKRVKGSPENYQHPDSCIVSIDTEPDISVVKLHKVSFKPGYINKIGNIGNIIHPAEWGVHFGEMPI